MALPCPPDRLDEFIGEPTPKARAVALAAKGPILVLGAAGKMGLHMTLMLSRARTTSDVIAVSRFSTLRAREDFERLGLRTLTCDLEQEGELARLPEAGTVFFLAGIKFGTSLDPDLLRRFNSEMPRKVADRFRRSRIVAYSSGAVYPFVAPESGGATEETAPAPHGEYAASCLGREKAFGEASARHGTAVALIRLNYAVEFRYGVLVDIAQKVLAGEPIDVTMGQVNVIWQGDAVAHSIQALELAASPAVPINVTGPGILSVRDLAERFGRRLGRPPRIIGKEAETSALSNASRSHRLFGPPRVALDDMIEWIASWLEQSGGTWGKPTGFERRDGRY